MPGRPGIGGQNRLTAEEARRRGTYRPCRHGSAKLSVVAPVTTPESAPEAPSKILEGLGDTGRAFLADLLETYTPDRFELHLARLAAEAVDDIARGRADGDLKGVRADTRRLLGLLTRMGLPNLRREESHP